MPKLSNCRSYQKIGMGLCYLKDSRAGEDRFSSQYGNIFQGNNPNYVSGTKDCPHVSWTFLYLPVLAKPLLELHKI